MTLLTDDLTRLVALSEKATRAIELAKGTELTSFERASATAAEFHFERELAAWFRAHHAELAAAVRDAERLDSLSAGCFTIHRTSSGTHWVIVDESTPLRTAIINIKLRTAIDEAIKEKVR